MNVENMTSREVATAHAMCEYRAAHAEYQRRKQQLEDARDKLVVARETLKGLAPELFEYVPHD